MVLTICVFGVTSGVAQSNNIIYTFLTIAGSPSNGSGDGFGANALFNNPQGTAVDGNFNIFVSDTGNHTIRKIMTLQTNWAVSTIAGLTGTNGSADGTNGSALFNSPQGIAVDGADNVYVADAGNDTIRKLVSAGTNWVASTIAGLAGSNGSADGTNSLARFDNPHGIAVDASGNLFVADSLNEAIRKITRAGTNWVVNTIAGGVYGSADGTNGFAQFNFPTGIAVDGADNVYVADTYNFTIRKLTHGTGTNWIVTTIAGLAGNSGSADGTNKNARFSTPGGIAVDRSNNLFVADSGNNTIREVVPSGTNWVVSTIGGIPQVAGYADGSGTNALFNNPVGICVNSAGDLFVDGSVVQGGVITLTVAAGAGAPFLQVILSPSSAIKDHAAWTLQGASDNWVASSTALPVLSNPAYLQFSNIIGWNVPVSAPLPALVSGLNVVNNLSYTVVSPVMVVNKAGGLGIAGTTNTTYIIQYSTSLTEPWQTLFTTVPLLKGTNQLETWPPPWPSGNKASATFFRAQWTGN